MKVIQVTLMVLLVIGCGEKDLSDSEKVSAPTTGLEALVREVSE